MLVGNGMHVLLHGWFPRFEYGRAGFPADPEGMERPERTRLALAGLRSIVPWERDGIRILRETRLDDGSPAFNERELRHMRDVRRLLLGLLALHAAGLALVVALALGARTRALARRGLAAGTLVTLGLFALVGVVLLLNPVWFLTGFHTIFFEGSSWRFADTDTLRRVFPDRFWSDTAVILAVATAVQAVAILALTSRDALRRAAGRLRRR